MNNQLCPPTLPLSIKTKISVLLIYILSSLSSQVYGQTTVKTQFNQALTDIKQGNLKHAETILQDLLTQQPDLHRARAELALIQVKNQQWQRAKKNINRLLVVDDLPSAVRVKLQRLNTTVQQHIDNQFKNKIIQPQHTFDGAVQFSLGYDTDFTLGNISEFLLDNNGNLGGIDTENLITDSIFLSNICGEEQPCSELFDLVASIDQQAISVSPDGYTNQNGEFISYNQLFNSVSSLETLPNELEDKGGFSRNQLNFRHKYRGTNDSYQWRNEVSLTVDTPFDNSLSYKQQIRVDSELSWRIKNNWQASGQIYYNDFRRDSEENFKYWGVQPELSYLSAFGRFSVRVDWLNKSFINQTTVQQNSVYSSLGLSWTTHFNNPDLLVNFNTGYADSNADNRFYDFTSKSVSVSTLYALNQKWEVYVAINQTFFDFPTRPSAKVKQLITSLNYSISENWHAFTSWEYNRIGNIYNINYKNRSVFHLGVQWQF
jgi:hypothetical protein